VILRPRLVERLNAGLLVRRASGAAGVFSRKLTIVSAPAGFGKTTLLSEWARALSVACSRVAGAWLSLDESDSDVTHFLAYLIAALRTVWEDAGGGALSLLQSRQTPSVDVILAMLINDIATSSQTGQDVCACVLFLDDYHCITSRSVHQAVRFLLNHLPLQLHLVLAGRADPPLPLARLRAQGQLKELRAADLRFAPDEAAAFLNDVMELRLSEADIAALDARTEGWIAGLQMAALSIQGRRDVTEFIRAFSGSHRFVLDYLVEEVLGGQPDLVQDFLLKTSILERMTASLCDAVVGGHDSQANLVQLERANVFLVPLDDERRWYRYHHLFADLLRSRLEQTQLDGVPALHRRAGEWYGQNGLIAEAVRHMLAAGDTERVADLVEGNALSLMDGGELKTLEAWLDFLPDEVMRSRPWLCVAHAWVMAYLGRFDVIESRLKDAERASRSGGRQSETGRIAGHAGTIRGYSTALEGDASRAAELARCALENLPEEDLRARGVAAAVLGGALKERGDLVAAAQAMAQAVAIGQAAGDSHVAVINLCDLARLQILQGRLHKAIATCQCALQLANEYARPSGGRLPVTGHVYTHLSCVLREWNDLEDAMRLAEEGVDLCRQWEWAELLVHGGIYLAQTRQAVGDTEGALDAIRRAKQDAGTLSTRYVGLVEAQEGLLWLAQGNRAAASRWAQGSGLSANDGVRFEQRLPYFALARVLIAERRLDEASGLLARLLSLMEAAGARGRVIEIAMLQALVLQAQGAKGRALPTLEHALSLAEPEGFVRIFIDEGAPMGDLLRQAAARGIRSDYVGALLRALESDAKAEGAQTTLVEPLSARELEVLRVLATGLSNREIAESLFIAVGTVKQHLKSIYGKLQVHSRTEAAHRARELGLL